MVYNNEVVGKGRNEVNQTKNVRELNCKQSTLMVGVESVYLFGEKIGLCSAHRCQWKGSFPKHLFLNGLISDYKSDTH